MAIDFPIVDAHVHLWDLDGPIRYPWLSPPFSDEGLHGSVEAIARTYTLDDYFADAVGYEVAKIVHVEAGAAPEDALAETRWLQATADTRGRPDAIVAFAALHEPGVERSLDAHAAHPNVRGVRHPACPARSAGATAASPCIRATIPCTSTLGRIRAARDGEPHAMVAA